MIPAEKSRAIAIASSLIQECGGQVKAAKLFGIKQPSVCLWLKNGIGFTRENDLRFRFPDLNTWNVFPPIRSN